MVRWRVAQSLYLRSTFGVGDRTRLRNRTTAQTQVLYARRENVRGKFRTWPERSISAESSDIYLSESNDILTPDKPRLAPVWQIKSREARKFFLNFWKPTFWQIGEGFFNFFAKNSYSTDRSTRQNKSDGNLNDKNYQIGLGLVNETQRPTWNKSKLNKFWRARAYNNVFMSAAGDRCLWRARFLTSFWPRGHGRASQAQPP